MNLEKIKHVLKNKQDLTFLVLGILMSLLVFLGIFYSIDFLTSGIKEVLGVEQSAKVSSVKFNTDKIKALEIDKIQK